MGTVSERRHYDPARPVVAFDFDGTLTVRDSFLAYLAFRAGPVAYRLGLIRLLAPAAAYLLHRDRGRLKAAAAAVYLKGMTESALEQSARRFAERAATTLLRPDAAQRWLDWKTRGAVMCIVTASPEPIVAPFAKMLGADVLIGTQLMLDAEGRVTGAFATENCRGPEKVARLEAMFGEGLRLAAAYGDTAGDREMLAIADSPGYRVFTGRPGPARAAPVKR